MVDGVEPDLRSEEIRPPLKWAGGKRWLVPYMRELWSRYASRRMIEPFCGGLAVTLGLRPTRALLNDINPHAVNFYRQVRAGLTIAMPLSNDPGLYYRYRDRFNELTREGASASVEAATLFYYLNRTGYNGLCRFNNSGGFNVPFGRYRVINYLDDFTAYRRRFAGWSFSCGDFAALELERDDFVYADPPYDVEFRKYAKEDFTWDDQVRLAEWLARHRGPVVASNQATDRVVSLYDGLGFKLSYLDGPRRISCTGDRRPAREVLAVRGL
jgi:DNA adenine methylase